MWRLKFLGNLIGMFFIECMVILVWFLSMVILSFFMKSFLLLIFVRGVFKILLFCVFIGISLMVIDG